MANGFQTLLKAGYDVRSDSFDKAEALVWATENGHVDAVRFLIERGVDLETKDSQDRSVVDLAIEYDQLAVLLALLESHPQLFRKRQYLEAIVALLSQADRNFYNGRMFGTMEVAAREGYTEIFRLLYNGMAQTKPKKALKTTFLHMACSCGDIATARVLLEEDVSRAGAIDAQGNTPLHKAFSREARRVEGSSEIVQILLSKGADIEARDEAGNSPLILATKNTHQAGIKVLVEHGADVTASDEKGNTALHEVAGSHELKKDLLQLLPGSDLEATNDEGKTPLMRAVQAWNQDMVKALIDGKANVMATDKDGKSVIHLAVLAENTYAIKLLGEADVEARDPVSKRTPLEQAAANGKLGVVRALLDIKANVDAMDDDGWTPLMWAVEWGHEEMVQLLIDNGASFEVKNNNDETALHIAAKYGQAEAMRVLLNAGAFVDPRGGRVRNGKTRAWMTPLHFAAKHGQVHTIKILLSHKANVEAKSRWDNTPLHMAASSDQRSIVRILVENGADPDARNKDGLTPLELAAHNGLCLGDELFEKPEEITEEYSYLALDGPCHIRILTIQPDDFEELVCCNLEAVPFDTAIYEALSYVWGNEVADKDIIISGKKFKVRDNVLSALRRVRKLAEPRSLWIDAICINQTDELERNQQVTLMTEIYSRASEVLIWYGKDETGAQSAVETVQAYHHEWLDGGGYAGLSWDPDMVKFLSNPWFTRAWIFQEIVCSKAATVYFGLREPIDTQHIRFGGKLTNKISWGTLGSFYEKEGESRVSQGVSSGPYSFIGPMAFFQQKYNAEDGTKIHLDLLTLLETRRDTKSTDHRDKVFSLLGLSTEGNNGTLQADYRMSVEDVYIDVARKLLVSRTDLRLLSAVQKRPEEFQALPSWVPDWRVPWNVKSLVYKSLYASPTRMRKPKVPEPTNIPEFNATAGVVRELEMDDNYPDRIKLKGRGFARIQAIVDFSSDILAESEANRLHDLGFPLGAQYPISQISYLTALCKTVVGDLFISDEELPEKPTFADVVEATKKRLEHTGAISSRCLFLADNSYIGLAPAHAQKGDDICLLFGGNVPYVVRKLQDNESEEHFQFIGECFCFGIMNGEAMDIYGGKDLGSRTYVFE